MFLKLQPVPGGKKIELTVEILGKTQVMKIYVTFLPRSHSHMVEVG